MTEVLLAAETPTLESLIAGTVKIGDVEIPLALILGVGVVLVVLLNQFGRAKSAAFKRQQMIRASERRFEIEHIGSVSRNLCKGLFWVFGLIFGLAFVLALLSDKNVFATGILWIGSLLLFGIGSLLGRTTSTMWMLPPEPSKAPDEDAREQFSFRRYFTRLD